MCVPRFVSLVYYCLLSVTGYYALSFKLSSVSLQMIVVILIVVV